MPSFDQINQEIIEQLIESGVDINSTGTYNGNDSYTLLHAAIDNYCDIESIKFILSKNPNVNALVKNYGPIDDDKDGDDSDDDDDEDDEMNGKYSKVTEKGKSFRDYSPLHIAVNKNRFDIVKLLVSYGAEINDNGQAIYIALKQENFEIAKFLIKHGFDVNDENNDGFSETVPINIALNRAYFEIIELLLINGADINCLVIINEGIFDIFFDNKIISKIFKKHVIKVKVLKSHTGDLENVDLSASEVLIPDEDEEDEMNDQWLKSYGIECEKEIQKMKTEMIGTSCLSYYELLRKNVYQLGMYAKNTSIATVLSDDEIEKNFPIYARLIKNCFRKGVLRKELLEQVEKQLPDIFSKLPYSVTSEIFSYLKYNDLRHFIIYLNDD